MDLLQYINEIHTLNESELFYKTYYEAKKNATQFKKFLRHLDIQECIKKHYIVPEIVSTIPDSMKDEYLINAGEHGISIIKHNCYTPKFIHFHNYFECVYVYEGTCLHSFNNNERLMKEGDFIVIPPFVSHSIYVNDESIVFNIIITKSVIQNIFKNPSYDRNTSLSNLFIENINLSSSKQILVFNSGNDENIRDIIIKMGLESKSKYPEYEIILTGYIGILFALLVRYYSDNATSLSEDDSKKTLINKIVIYIQQHYDNISLEDVAQKFHYSKEYISQFIKENYGKTYIDILTETRMTNALRYLSMPNLSITDIAFRIGYNNVENFIRTFKQEFGKTPSVYRKSLK